MTRYAAALCALFSGPLAAQTSLPDWPLTFVDGGKPGFAATIILDPPGQVRGRGPCNGYSAALTDDLPAFGIEAILSTKMACPDLAAEQRFFDLLGRMDHAEQTDGTLILTGGGHVLVFSRVP